MTQDNSSRIITLSSYPRAIVHIDGDAFFASCEQAQQPSLKGKPLITGKERGIISSASYEAKALGIKRGISISEAKKIYPQLIVLSSDYETYSLYSQRMCAIIRRFTPDVEEFSIDEAFCDITGLRRIYRASYPSIARKIKGTIQKELDITVSAGISLSKTLAKICSRYQKPDGFTAVAGLRLHEFLKDIPLEMVCGFGKNTVELLNKYGVRNVLEYIHRPLFFARNLLGKIGEELWLELRGESVYPLTTDSKAKYLSISKTKTFIPASKNRDFVRAKLLRNLESACIKLRRHKLSALGLAIHLRTANFENQGLSAQLNRHCSSTIDFTGICSRLFEMLFTPGVSYRATGIVLLEIVSEGIDDRTLFDDPLRIKKIDRLYAALDSINKRYGKHTVHLAGAHAAGILKQTHSRNTIARRKKELLKGETFRRRLGIPLLKLN